MPAIIPADQRDALIWTDESTKVKRDAMYVNELVGYCHRSALGLNAPGAPADPNARAKMIPAWRPGPDSGPLRPAPEPDGFHILVLLSTPVRAICTENQSTVLFSAAIMREYGDGKCEAWLISNHQSALETWAENYPEASAP